MPYTMDGQVGGMALSTVAPPPIADASTAGVSPTAARSDHTHTTSVQRKILTLDSNGEAVWTFATPYAQPPVITCAVEDGATAQPIVVKIVERSTTAIKIKGMRAQKLPSSLLNLAVLINFDAFAGTTPAGVKVHVMAGKESQ